MSRTRITRITNLKIRVHPFWKEIYAIWHLFAIWRLSYLLGLGKILDKPLKTAFLLSNDEETKYFDDKILAVHAVMFLG